MTISVSRDLRFGAPYYNDVLPRLCVRVGNVYECEEHLHYSNISLRGRGLDQ